MKNQFYLIAEKRTWPSIEQLYKFPNLGTEFQGNVVGERSFLRLIQALNHVQHEPGMNQSGNHENRMHPQEVEWHFMCSMVFRSGQCSLF